MARVSEGLISKSGKERFKLDQVVFLYTQYMKAVIRLKLGKIIVFDEPSYAMGKRDWYKDLNKALVQTIESARFKVHPLFIPIINKALLDRTIRSYLIQFQIEVRDRGRAVVYRIYPSQHTEKIYRYTYCYLEYDLFDNDQCSRDSCLDCSRLLQKKDGAHVCNLFRARYERKKANIQDVRYEQALDSAQYKETQELTFDQLLRIIMNDYELREEYKAEGNVNAALVREILRDKHTIKISRNKAYDLRASMIRALDKPSA